MDTPALTLPLLAFRALALLLIAGTHGFVIARAGVMLGDPGPRYDGRVTVWPFVHIDLAGAAGLIVFGLGWAKPVAIEPEKFRIGRFGVLIAILAGFAGLLALAAALTLLVAPALTMLPHSAALTSSAFLRTASELSIWCALFSLVPIPPLAGGMLFSALGWNVPPKVTWLLSALMLAAVATGLAQSLLRPVYTLLSAVVFGG